MEAVFLNHNIPVMREYRFDKKNIVDYFQKGTGIAIEVKIKKNNSIDTFKQCERYAQFEEVKMIILFTNKAQGMPSSINGKPVYVISAGRAWL